MSVNPSKLAGYQTQAQDICMEADLLCFDLWRQRSVTQRLQMGAQLTRSARQLAIDCFTQRFTHLSQTQLAGKIAKAWLSDHCPPEYIPPYAPMSWIQDSIQLAAQLHLLLVEFGVPYYITGGVAAIAYGEPRTTQDLDVVLLISPSEITSLAPVLEAAGFYLAGVEDVINQRMETLQIIQLETISRADLIIAPPHPYEQLKLTRRQSYTLSNGEQIYLASPEDVIISKLRWGRGSRSQKQWRDVLGILKTQGEILDYQYMYHWSFEFNLSATLEGATLAAGVREIASQQWAADTLAIMERAWEIAQNRDRIIQMSPGVEVAQGNIYTLTKDSSAQVFTVISRVNHQEIACYDGQGKVLRANPSVEDRQQWQQIRQRIENS